MNILSIDWDYFFPDMLDFDWGHNEDNGILFEQIWSYRPGNIGLKSGKMAVDIMHPDPKLLTGFWDKIKEKPAKLIVAESHRSLYETLKEMKLGWPCTIYNFDAHHDLGYFKKKPGKINCGNWGYLGFQQKLIKKWMQIYPPWRKDTPEQPPCRKRGVEIHYTPPKLPDWFGVVFICRSSSWTPSWSDDYWLEFIEHWKADKFLWNSKGYSEFALKERNPNLEEAKKIAAEYRKVIDQLRRQNNDRKHFEKTGNKGRPNRGKEISNRSQVS